MKARPILFNAEMVRALLDGQKTQTRRPISPQPPRWEWNIHKADRLNVQLDDGKWVRCPTGKPGDLLYVRETFRLFEGCGCSDHCVCPPTGTPFYRAGDDDGESNWKPSIHMPRWASRLTLEITDIRVERVQDISEEDAMAEGLKKWPYKNDFAYGYDGGAIDGHGSAPGAFHALWNSIYSNWNDNPWIWVVEFKVIHANVDEVLKKEG